MDAESPSPLLAGRYRLEQRLGRGGMGEVWAAHDNVLDRAVAVKLLRDDRATQDPTLRARFVSEARASARFHHPNVVDVFDAGADADSFYLVMERLPQAREAVPEGVGTPEMGPIATGLGEIYQFKVSGSRYSLMELRSILDWQVAPRLRTVPGVVEVNTHGGQLKTYEVQVDSDKLMAYRISLRTIIEALERNNANAGGAYLERSEQQSLIRGEGLISSLADIENIGVGASPTGTPVLIRNIANVRFAPMVRQGFATQDGKGEIVIGVAMMLIGENSRTVAASVMPVLFFGFRAATDADRLASEQR